MILSDDIEINNDKKEEIIEDFIDILKKCEYSILLKSFSKIFSEILYSIYKDDFLDKIKKELINKETLFLKNITYIFLHNDDSDTNIILNNLFSNEKTEKQTFDVFQKFNNYKNTFIRSKSFLILLKKYLINNHVYNEDRLFDRYMELMDCALLSDHDLNDEKIINMFNEENDNMIKKELFYHILKLGHIDNSLINSVQVKLIEDEKYKESFFKASVMFNENYASKVGGSVSTSYHGEEILIQTDNENYIYDLVNLKILKVHDKTHIKNTQFKAYSKEKKNSYKFYINYLQGDKCCQNSMDYFITQYRQEETLMNFFGWENFLFENFSKNYTELSIILLENIKSYENYVIRIKDVVQRNIISSEYFDKLIPPIQLFFLTSLNKEYNNDLINKCLKYFESIDSKKKKEKEGTYYLLYENLNPYNI